MAVTNPEDYSPMFGQATPMTDKPTDTAGLVARINDRMMEAAQRAQRAGGQVTLLDLARIAVRETSTKQADSDKRIAELEAAITLARCCIKVGGVTHAEMTLARKVIDEALNDTAHEEIGK